MKKIKLHIWIIFGIIFTLMINRTFFIVTADDHGKHNNGKWYQKFMRDHDDDDEKGEHHQKKHRKHDDHDAEYDLMPSLNPIHIEACGSCHWAYPPDLLPARSWDKILAELEDHFGDVVDLDPESKSTIAEYLNTNAAEQSSGKLSSKIMRSIGDQTPERITQIPYILKEHHEIELEVLKRESIGSLSNCIACHTTAEKGDFDDDNVSIPK